VLQAESSAAEVVEGVAQEGDVLGAGQVDRCGFT
jgi:hypothetical protein